MKDGKEKMRSRVLLGLLSHCPMHDSVAQLMLQLNCPEPKPTNGSPIDYCCSPSAKVVMSFHMFLPFVSAIYTASYLRKFCQKIHDPWSMIDVTVKSEAHQRLHAHRLASCLSYILCHTAPVPHWSRSTTLFPSRPRGHCHPRQVSIDVVFVSKLTLMKQ